ncbi:MAG: hypothetical protein IKZ53_06840 [Selenomonadaceae bacterium]|nr:hypothetical protein [Selenomonadaceae bacterium]
MGEENLSAEFNELSDFAQQILSKVGIKLAETHSELEETRQAFGNTLRETEELRKELNTTKQNLSAELAKSQEARCQIESERDYLRGEVRKLTSSYEALSVSFRSTQAELSRAKDELRRLQDKISQAHKILAG